MVSRATVPPSRSKCRASSVVASKSASDYYDLISNTKMANRLEGKLLLVHGFEDENVPFKHAIEMYDALIQADKPFDSLIIPTEAHGA